MANEVSGFLMSELGKDVKGNGSDRVTSRERDILRDLAKQVAETASLPVMAERREMWKRHNRLERVRPMILVFPDGAWRELLPPSALDCEGAKAREIEWTLRSRLYHWEHIHDDTVIERDWTVHKRITDTGWGLEARVHASHQETGAWRFYPVIEAPGDLEKLRMPEVIHDEQGSRQDLEEAQELFGDILDVQSRGIGRVSFHLMSTYTRLRGLEQVMWDMHDNPGMLHDAMAFLEKGSRGLIRQYLDQNLLSTNNDGTYHSSGGVGYSTELPKPGFDPDRVRLCDLWASAEAQEMAQVSPRMHAEFILQYEKRLLEPFGLNGYGCCEDLTDKLDDVFTIPNLRRISISPWANVEECAERLGSEYIFSWKPHPAHLVGEFDSAAVRQYIDRTLEHTRNCVIEMILKDTHTCQHHPERFTQWTDIAQEAVESY